MCNTRKSKQVWQVNVRCTETITVEADNAAEAGAKALVLAQCKGVRNIRVNSAVFIGERFEGG